MRKKIYLLLPFCLFIIGCTTPKKEVQIKDTIIKEDKYKELITSNTEIKETSKTPLEELNEKEEKLDKKNNLVQMNKAIMEFYSEWKNVKYVYGGNSKKGIDCSAFTQRIYKEKLDVKIPRTTWTQVKVGKEVKKSELKLGDLIFFKTGVRNRHVGIYMGNGDFMHASVKGIKFTKVDKPFYKKHYWTSRRIIN